MIRLATPADRDTVAGLLIAFRDHMGSTNPPDETFHTVVATLLEDPNSEYLLAGSDGVAQLRYRLSVWTGAPDCWLEDLYVQESARGRGLGRALVEAAFERARSRGCRRIELDTTDDNTGAIRLYESLGFSLMPKGTGRSLFLGRKL